MMRKAVWVFIMFASMLVVLLGPGRGPRPTSAQDVPEEPAAPPVSTALPAPTPAPSGTPVPAGPPTTHAPIGAYNDAPVASGGRWGPNQNLGGLPELTAGPRDGGYFRSYVRFLLAGLPAGIQIDSARLVLTPMGGGDQPVNLSAGVVQEDWDEGSITWNQQPLSTYEAATARWRPGQSAPVVLDLTDVARAWYACGGTSNNGILISADLASSWVAFGSRKSESPPVLDLVYEQSSSPVNCSAPPVSGISLAPPQVSAPSTTGAQLGSVNPNAPVPVAGVGTPAPTPCPNGLCSITGKGDSNTGLSSTPAAGSTTSVPITVASTPTPGATPAPSATPKR